MENHEKTEGLPANHPQPSETTRRSLLAIAGTLAATAVSAVVPATAASGKVEGFFLVYEPKGSGSDPDADTRIFFLSSEWLQYFEVTDVYRQMNMDPADVVRNIRQSGSAKVRRMKVLYSDVADIVGPVGGTTLITPRPPVGSETYLAMMISPSAVPST